MTMTRAGDSRAGQARALLASRALLPCDGFALTHTWLQRSNTGTVDAAEDTAPGDT
jgi:hypothetical protein